MINIREENSNIDRFIVSRRPEGVRSRDCEDTVSSLDQLFEPCGSHKSVDDHYMPGLFSFNSGLSQFF